MDLTVPRAPFFDVLCRTVRVALDCRHAQVCMDQAGKTHAASPVLIEDLQRTAHPARELFPDARFTAAAPLRRGVAVVGTLWVTDSLPRTITADVQDRLEDFASLGSLYLQQETDATLFRLVAENSADTLIRGTLDGVRRYVSPSIRALLGYDAEELVGKRASEITHPDDVEDFGRHMLAMRDGRVDSFTTEHRMRHKDGTWVWIEAFVRVTLDSTTGLRDGYVVSVRDTSRRKELESELVHNASHDLLTGLPNRALLDERLAEQIDRGGAFAVLCVDLDGFKRVNDELGHHIGDMVLALVADRLVSCVGARDTVSRRGGDEFVILHATDGSLLESAVALAQCVIDAATAPMTLGEWSGSVGLSIGIAVSAAIPEPGQDVLRAADRAMYDAKASGHNAYRIAD